MLKFISLIVLLLTATATRGGLAAQVNVDSLLSQLEVLTDTNERLTQISSWTQGRSFSDFSDPLPLFTAHLATAKAAGDRLVELTAARGLIGACNFRGEFARADSLALHYVERLVETDAPELRAALYHEAGKSAYFARAYDQTIDYEILGLTALAALPDRHRADSMAARLHNYLGKAYNSAGQFVPAAQTLAKAIELHRQTGIDTILMVELFTELGIVYSQIGLFERAVGYLDQSAQFGAGLPNVSRVSTLANIARNLVISGDYPAAVARYHAALAITLDPPRVLITHGYLYNGLVEAYHRMHQPDSLNYYYRRFKAFRERFPGQEATNDVLFRQSTWLYDLNNGRPSHALTVGEELYAEALETGDPADLLLYTEWLAATHRALGNYRLADEFTRRLMQRKDSIQSANKNDALLLYYNQFETQEKENEIVRLDGERIQLAAAAAKISADRKLYQTVALSLALLLLTSLYFFYKIRSARQKLAVQNEALNRLNATKDRFFGIIAHDLRNPVAAMSTADYQIDHYIRKGHLEEVGKVATLLGNATRNLGRLLDNLLNWALSQQGLLPYHPERVEVATEVEKMFDLHLPAAAGKDITLDHAVPDDLTVFADRPALSAMFRNLLSNAIKFTPRGGRVTVAATAVGGRTTLSVADTGIGMSPERIAELFEIGKSSHTGTAGETGTGLGLILVRDLAERNGGSLRVESHPGRGSIFRIELPTARTEMPTEFKSATA